MVGFRRVLLFVAIISVLALATAVAPCSAQTVVSASDCRIVAGRCLQQQAALHPEWSWSGAQLGPEQTFTDLSGTPAVRVFPVATAGRDTGYITISACRDRGPFIECGTGLSPLAALRDTGGASARLIYTRGDEYYSQAPDGTLRGLLSGVSSSARDVAWATSISSWSAKNAAARWDRALAPAEPPALVQPQSVGSAAIAGVPVYGWYRGCVPSTMSMILSYWGTQGHAPLAYQGLSHAYDTLDDTDHDWYPPYVYSAPGRYTTARMLTDLLANAGGLVYETSNADLYGLNERDAARIANLVANKHGYCFDVAVTNSASFTRVSSELAAGRPLAISRWPLNSGDRGGHMTVAIEAAQTLLGNQITEIDPAAGTGTMRTWAWDEYDVRNIVTIKPGPVYSIAIQSPTATDPALVDLASAGSAKITACVRPYRSGRFINGLGNRLEHPEQPEPDLAHAFDFTATVGGLEALVVGVREQGGAQVDSDHYELDIVPPTGLGAGRHSLQVRVGAAAGTMSGAVEYGTGRNADIVLVIDRSSSMSGTAIADAVAAARTFVGFMREGDAIGIVSYEATARVDFPLTVITDAGVKSDAIAAINTIGAYGNTSVGAGLQLGQEQLSTRGRTSSAHVMVVMSDGYENRAPFVRDVIPNVPPKTDIHAVALGQNVDEALMSHDIAAATGGRYYRAPTSAELQELYAIICGSVSGVSVILTESGTIQQGQTINHDFSVDGSTSGLVVGLSWPGSELALRLRRPNGTWIDAGATDPNVEFVVRETGISVDIESPAPGNWRAEITAVSVPSNGEPYSIVGMADSLVTLKARAGKERYAPGEAIVIQAAISSGTSSIRNAVVSAAIYPPGTSAYAAGDRSKWIEVNGDSVPPPQATLEAASVEYLSLYDDGAHGDGSRNDGIYANCYSTSSTPGSYRFDITASGSDSGGYQFARRDSVSVFVEGEAIPSFTINPEDLDIGTLPELGSATAGLRLISANDADMTVRLVPGNLTSATGKVLPASGVSISDPGAGPPMAAAPVDTSAANMLYTLPAGGELPLSLSLQVPLWTDAGLYTGAMGFAGPDGVTYVDVSVNVTLLVVDIPDAQLQQDVRECINKPSQDILARDLAGLQVLYVGDGVADLTGLEFCGSIEQLETYDSPITDLSPIERLTTLRTLRVINGRLADIELLGGLGNLQVLCLRGNRITDITALQTLSGLTELDLGENNIDDAAALAGLTNLRQLNLDGNQLNDITPLADLTGLRTLSLASNALRDISALGQIAFTNLGTLDLTDNLISDIGPLLQIACLGEGDVIHLTQNWLDLSAGTQASADLAALRARGVTVYVDPQQPHTVAITTGPTGAPNPVESGAEVVCASIAEDNREGSTFTYSWTAVDAEGNPAGSFDDATAQNPTWTAPINRHDDPAEYELTVTATCVEAPAVSGTSSYTQLVQPCVHTVEITDGPSIPATDLVSGTQVECSVSAEDSRIGHSMTFAWSAEDGVGNPAGSFNDAGAARPIWTAPETASTEPSEYRLTVRVGCESDAGLVDEGSCTVRVRAGRWHRFAAGRRMFGVPVVQDGAAGILHTQAAPDALWWNPATEHYVPLAAGDPYIAGRAYWSSFTADTDFMVPGTPVTGNLDYPVSNGWNMICSPYDFVTAIGPILNATSLACPIAWTDQGNGYELVALLDDSLNLVHTDIQPWWGYWVLSEGNGVIPWTAPGQAAADEVQLLRLGQVDGDAGGWQIPICVEAGGRADMVNYIGMAGADGVKALSIPNPPARDGSVDLFFPSDAGPMATDIRRLPASEASFDFVVTCDLDAPVRLSFPDLSALPHTSSIKLDDQAAGKSVNLRTVHSYEYTDAAPRHFRIEVRQGAGNTLTVGGVTAQQANGGQMAISYTLSADAAVDVQVRNISGRPIRTIPCGECSAGINVATWDLRNSSGAMVPSGLYLCTITCRAEDGTQVSAISTARVRR